MCESHHGRHSRHDGPCHPAVSRVRGFVQPWLLLLLLKKPRHGYELMEQLAEDEDMPVADPGFLYRTLRQLEAEGLVISSWETEHGGPARRLYEVTPEGVEYLHAWAVNIRRTRDRLDRFLHEYGAYFSADQEGGENHV